MIQSTGILEMVEWVDTRPAISIQESEYKRLLGYPRDFTVDGRARELMELTTKWYAENGQPWIYVRQIDGQETTNQRVRVNGTQFASKQLCDQLTAVDARSAFLAVVSAGRSCEERARDLWRESKPDEYFFMEMYGSAVVEHLITSAGARICGWAEQRGMAVLPHYSPGYSGWDIADQTGLWELINHQRRHDFPEGITVMETGMLQPKKSLLALFGITRQPEKLQSFSRFIPCENCSFSPCQYRRAPYRYSLPQIEDVRRFQSGGNVDGRLGVENAVLDRNARYSVNLRALRKWSQERVQLNFAKDGSIEALFRYEGTTCSNMGRPLEFHYRIKLASAQQDYRILEAVCVPAPGDTGHAQMCEYINNAAALMASIASEKPLLGRPINDVLSWKRGFNPSGCYCDIERRTHKWGLVLEVIHHALVQHEKGISQNGNLEFKSVQESNYDKTL
jgi:hypothetical protein